MKKNIGLLIVIMILFGLVLGGCVKPASEAPDDDTTNSDQADVVVRVMATQTALAKDSEEGDDVEPTAEPTEADDTSDDAEEPAATATEEPVVEPTEEPTEEPTPAATAVVVVPGTYTVHYGEHPYCLARRFDIDADELLSANGLVRGDQLDPGNVLTIPQGGSPFNGDRVLSIHPTSFTVQYMDTFYSIACYFGDVTPEAIAAENSMTVDEVLVTGSVIQIP